MRRAWNHNIQYHDVVVRSMPGRCVRGLDVGCGRGLLTRQLARRCGEVIGIDMDGDVLPAALVSEDLQTNVRFVAGDAMAYPFPIASFDFIAVVATLHHLPLERALMRFQDLLKPGGVLTVIGLYRASTWSDHALAAVALPASRLWRSLRRYEDVQAPTRRPEETLRTIRLAADTLLPGAVLRRRLFFRYSLVWRKPPEN